MSDEKLGKYHLSSDGMRVLQPHPSAKSEFARTQGYVIVTIADAYKHLGPLLVEAMNKMPERKFELLHEGGKDHGSNVLGGEVAETNVYLSAYAETVKGEKSWWQLDVGESCVARYRLSGESNTYRILRTQ